MTAKMLAHLSAVLIAALTGLLEVSRLSTVVGELLPSPLARFCWRYMTMGAANNSLSLLEYRDLFFLFLLQAAQWI